MIESDTYIVGGFMQDEERVVSLFLVEGLWYNFDRFFNEWVSTLFR